MNYQLDEAKFRKAIHSWNYYLQKNKAHFFEISETKLSRLVNGKKEWDSLSIKEYCKICNVIGRHPAEFLTEKS